MSKKRLPPLTTTPTTLYGPNIRQYKIASWNPSPDPDRPPTAVAIVIQTVSVGDLVLRLNSPDAVDATIQALLRHKRHVWPDAP